MAHPSCPQELHTRRRMENTMDFLHLDSLTVFRCERDESHIRRLVEPFVLVCYDDRCNVFSDEVAVTG